MVESCTIFNLLMQLSLSSGDMETLPFMNSTFPKRFSTSGSWHTYMHTALKQSVAILLYSSTPQSPQKGMKIWRTAKIIKFHILQILEDKSVGPNNGGWKYGRHPPTPCRMGWSDIHLSNYHLSIRAQFTITTWWCFNPLWRRSTALQINRRDGEVHLGGFNRIGVPSTRGRRWRGWDKSGFDLRLLVPTIGHLPLQPTPAPPPQTVHQCHLENQKIWKIWESGNHDIT